MEVVDLMFRVTGSKPIRVDHGYHLYAAITQILPRIHQEHTVGIHPIGGQQIGHRLLELTNRSRLILRTDTAQIADLIQLSGKLLKVSGSSVRVGTPEVSVLSPSTEIRSRLVTTKNGQDQARFEKEVRRQLDRLGVSEDAVPIIRRRADGTLIRRTVRIRGKEIVGYELLIEGLTAEESLNVQEKGIGGRRHMGCGVFVPFGGGRVNLAAHTSDQKVLS